MLGFCHQDWVAGNTRGVPSLVTGSGLRAPDRFTADTHSAALIFDEIAHKCLLLLHLELRIQCFHYLGQEEKEGEEEERSESGGGAGRLAHALLAFHEHASPVLAPHRLAYIMEGIGEMMSAAVVWRARTHSAGTVARLAALRHCLAALHLPHDGLQRAHEYTHLLTNHPQEIINSVREKGPQFSELEYLNAFKVIGAQRGISQSDMKQYFKELSAALGHVGVTV